jgi:hypothetical protein
MQQSWEGSDVVNGFLAAAALLSVAGGVIHSVLGERLIFRALSPESLPAVTGSGDFTRQVLRFFWHLVSVAWWGFAVLLWHLAEHDALEGLARGTAVVIGWTFFASALVALVGSKGKHFAWVILLVIAACVWLGFR